MKILHIISSLGDGGAEAILYRLCINDQKNCHIVVSMKDEGKYGPLLKDSGIPVISLYWGNYNLNIKSLINFYSIIKKHNPDIIQTWMYHASLIGGIIGKLGGCHKIFWGMHNAELVPNGTKIRTFILQKICRLSSYFLPNSIIYVSKRAMDTHHQIGFDKKKSIIIWNGIDPSLFSPSSQDRKKIISELRLNEQDFIVGVVSRYDPFKDYQNIFSAINELELAGLNFTYLFVGSGNTNNNKELTTLIQQSCSSSQIILLGPRNDIPKIMNTIDLLVVSSKSESFGNVMIEAMSCGTPCVSTNVGAAIEIIGETGWIVISENSNQLANAISNAHTAWNNKAKWQERKICARNQILNNFSIDMMVKKYQIIWDSTSQ